MQASSDGINHTMPIPAFGVHPTRPMRANTDYAG